MIIPSIDIMGGKAVQLENGKTKKLEVEDIESLAEKFRVLPQTNVIDLDAAFGKGDNKELIKSLCAKLCCNVGGGIRTKELALEYLRAGAKNIIIGTTATPAFLKELPTHRVIVALDVKGGKVAIEGWQKTVAGEFKDKIKELEKHCAGFLVTNVDVEGLSSGSDLSFIRSLSGTTEKPIMVAGGISSYEEIKQIDSLGFDQVLGMSLYTGKIDLYEAFAKTLDLSKGLIPTIAQDTDGQILMVANSNKESVLKSLSERKATYFSRKRSSLWTKGETSGHHQELLSVRYDCDADALVYTVRQRGVACHTGKYSCFGKREFCLSYLLSFLGQRLENSEKGSYTRMIATKEEKLHKKILEEAFEVALASRREDRIWEVADLLYFIMVYMAKHGLSFDDIRNELSLRHVTDEDDL